MGKLSNKKIHLSCFVLFAIVNVFFFQNCSNGQYISPNLLESSLNASNTTGAPSLPSIPALAPEPTGKTKTVFMATGHVGRTVMSYDDGQSWKKKTFTIANKTKQLR